MAGTLTVSGMSAGLPSGQKVIGPVTTTGTNAIGAIVDTTLSSGDNSFTIPTGATAVCIFLGQAPTAIVTVRTNVNQADTGLQIAPLAGTVAWTKFDLVAAATTVILNSNGSLTGVELSFI